MRKKPNYDPKKHHRRSIRLKGYNYSSEGFYFITICTEGRRCLFGTIINGKMVLNDYGKIVDNEWQNTIKIRNGDVVLHEYVIMPNHIHILLTINWKLALVMVCIAPIVAVIAIKFRQKIRPFLCLKQRVFDLNLFFLRIFCGRSHAPRFSIRILNQSGQGADLQNKHLLSEKQNTRDRFIHRPFGRTLRKPSTA